MNIAFALVLLAGLSAAEVDVVPLVEEWNLDQMMNAYTLVTWSTLIQDGDFAIVVDLPPVANETAKTKLIDALKAKDLTPEDVQKLVMTHGGRPTILGKKSIFPKANQYFSTYEHNGLTFLRTGLYENGKVQLTPNVQLWYTPGNAAEDITVMVSNVAKRGTVAIAGNLIFNADDVLDSKYWESKALHVQAGLKRRRKVICHANFVIPGHGAIFEVTDEHRAAVKCSENGKADENVQDAIADLRRRRRQHDQERWQREQEEWQRNEQARRDRDYEESLRKWREDQARAGLVPSEISIGAGASANGGIDCCWQEPCQANQPLCSSVGVGSGATSACCTQPPCQVQQPPCSFASSCCQESQSCGWNQVRCRSSCCASAPAPCDYPQRSPQVNEVHHHYIGGETEIFRETIKRDQHELSKTVDDQQKKIRDEHHNVTLMFLDHINESNSFIERYLEEETRQRKEFEDIVRRQRQEMETIYKQHADELQAHMRKASPAASLDSHRKNIQHQYEAHKRGYDEYWAHQETVKQTQKAQEETKFRKVQKPGHNYTTTNTVQKEAERTERTECTQGCNTGCNQGCNSGCNQGCNSGCNQGCNSGCATGGSSGGCAQGCTSGCNNALPPRVPAPGRRHAGGRRRIRLRRHEVDEKRQQRKLQKLQQMLASEDADE